MENKNNGGPAFPMPSGPEPRVSESTHFNEGMTLRDYFAAHSPYTEKDVWLYWLDNKPEKPTHRMVYKILAQMNYGYADAMLAERNKS